MGYTLEISNCNDEYEDALLELDDAIENICPSGRWHAEGKSMGWQKRSGYKDFDAETGQEFLDNIMPNTDWNATIIIDNVEKSIKMTVYHHDAPTGESYVITPSIGTEEEEEDYEQY